MKARKKRVYQNLLCASQEAESSGANDNSWTTNLEFGRPCDLVLTEILLA